MPKGADKEYWACLTIAVYINYMTVFLLSWVAWQCCLLYTIHVYELYLWLPSLYVYFTIYLKCTFLRDVHLTNSVSLHYDCVVSTPHICVVPYEVYRWRGLQWHCVYIDFHKHWFVNACNAPVLCTNITVCLQPDLILGMIVYGVAVSEDCLNELEVLFISLPL